MNTHRIRQYSTSVIAFGMLVSLLTGTRANASPAKDFTIATTQTSFNVASGSSVGIPISIQRGAQFKAPLKFSVRSKLSKVKMTMQKVSANEMTLIVIAKPNASLQEGTVKITASGGQKVRTLILRAAVVDPGLEQVAGGPTPVTVSATPSTTPPPTAPPTAATTLAPTPTTAPPPTIAAIVGDFSVKPLYKVANLKPGVLTEVPVVLTALNGYAGKPKIDIIDLPYGTTATEINRWTPGPPDQFGYTIGITAGSGSGAKVLTVQLRAIDGSTIRTAPLILKLGDFGSTFSATARFLTAQVVPGGKANFFVTTSVDRGDMPGAEIRSLTLPPGATAAMKVGDTMAGNFSFAVTFPASQPLGTVKIEMELIVISGQLKNARPVAEILVSTKPRVTSVVSSASVQAGTPAVFAFVYERIEGIADPTYTIISNIPKGSATLVPGSDATNFGVLIGTTPSVIFAPGTPPGTYPVTVRATSGGQTTDVVVNVVVS
jgi:hypothetical protein